MSDLSGLDQFVNDCLAQWTSSGVAIAVVKDGDVVLSQGCGYRDVENKLPVTSETLFAIGSSTKAFTAMSIALLVDEGKLDWDKPVRDFVPTFRLFDGTASEHATPRDLLSHRTGMPRHDLMWYGSPLTRQEIFGRLRYLEPNKDFRQIWQYQNLMYLSAGVIVRELTGLVWEDFVRARILEPLDMSHTTFTSVQAQSSPDCAVPHSEKDGVLKRIPYRDLPEVAPAGSIYSNLNDMVCWLNFLLNGGKVGDTRLVSEGNLQQMLTPQMVIPDPVKYTELLHMSYGMGWFIQPYRGRYYVHHGGNIDGFSTLVSLLPRERIGIVAFSNMNGSNLPAIATYNVMDRLLGLDPIDWNGRFWQDHVELRQAVKRGQDKAQETQRANAPATHALSEFAGEYTHPGYGTCTIQQTGDALTFVFNGLELPMKHLNYDTFEAAYELFDVRMPVQFGLDFNGNVEMVKMPLEPNVGPIVFQRAPDKLMTDTAFLYKFAGDYELMGLRLSVALKGENGLSAQVQGQPEIELEPYQGTKFNLKGMTGFSIEFVLDETGKVSKALVDQAGTVFEAKRVTA